MAGWREWRDNLVASGGQDEYYTYDALNRLKTLKRGDLNAGKTDSSGTPVWQKDFNYDPTGNWRGTTNAYVTKVNGTTTLDQNRTHNLAIGLVRTLLLALSLFIAGCATKHAPRSALVVMRIDALRCTSSNVVEVVVILENRGHASISFLEDSVGYVLYDVDFTDDSGNHWRIERPPPRRGHGPLSREVRLVRGGRTDVTLLVRTSGGAPKVVNEHLIGATALPSLAKSLKYSMRGAFFAFDDAHSPLFSVIALYGV